LTRFPPGPAASTSQANRRLACWPVSKRVGSVKNNDPSFGEPIALAD